MQDEQLRYPIGKYKQPEVITDEQVQQWIEELAVLPADLRHSIAGMSDEQLRTPYREGGWKVCQVIHHLPDSHINAYVRFKLALTEQKPTIKPYREDLWASLADSERTPIDVSLGLLEHLHARWVVLLKSMTVDDFRRTYFHPEHLQEFTLAGILGMYAWHGKHHRAQIEALKERMGW